MTDRFRAMMIVEHDGRPRGEFRDLTVADLPDHDVLVAIAFSTLDYKDGLAISGKGKIARRLPMVAGIDLAGTVVETRSPDWKAGDKVLVNGWGLSETEWGGYARFQKLKPLVFAGLYPVLPRSQDGERLIGCVDLEDFVTAVPQETNGHRPRRQF